MEQNNSDADGRVPKHEQPISERMANYGGYSDPY